MRCVCDISLLKKTGMWFGPLKQNLGGCRFTVMRKWKWLFLMAVLELLDLEGKVL
jgi:hypothetical protein